MKRCREGGVGGPHGDYREGCKMCLKARTDEKYARHWGEPWPPPKVEGAPDPPAPGVAPPGRDAPRAAPPAIRSPLPHLRSPCKYQGALIQECTSCGSEARHVYYCDHPTKEYDRCTRGNPNSGFQTCFACPDYRSNYEWVSTAGLVRDAIALAGGLPPDASGVAGIPRSGMVAASVVAVHLHLPLWELAEDGGLRRMGSGKRGGVLRFGDSSGPVVVVDDTVHNGGTMTRARRALADRGVASHFAAVYVRPGTERVVDSYARTLHTPHLLEWNLFNQSFTRFVGTDLDGVLCHDRDSGGPVGEPYLLPRVLPVPLVVTGRPERHRAATEGWLRRWGVRCDRLEMYPGDDPSAEAIAEHKADHYRSSGCHFFVESCPAQAEAIQRATGRPVICPRVGKVFQ